MSLRRRFGLEMVATFRALLEERTTQGGLQGLAGAWWLALRDLANPLPERPRRRSGPRQREAPGVGKDPNTGLLGWVEDLGFAWRSVTRDARFAALRNNFV